MGVNKHAFREVHLVHKSRERGNRALVIVL